MWEIHRIPEIQVSGDEHAGHQSQSNAGNIQRQGHLEHDKCAQERRDMKQHFDFVFSKQPNPWCFAAAAALSKPVSLQGNSSCTAASGCPPQIIQKLRCGTYRQQSGVHEQEVGNKSSADELQRVKDTGEWGHELAALSSFPAFTMTLTSIPLT